MCHVFRKCHFVAYPDARLAFRGDGNLVVVGRAFRDVVRNGIALRSMPRSMSVKLLEPAGKEVTLFFTGDRRVISAGYTYITDANGYLKQNRGRDLPVIKAPNYSYSSWLNINSRSVKLGMGTQSWRVGY